MTPFSEPSFFQGDRHTYRRVATVGTLFCLAFVAISFSLRPQVEDTPRSPDLPRFIRATTFALDLQLRPELHHLPGRHAEERR